MEVSNLNSDKVSEENMGTLQVISQHNVHAERMNNKRNIHKRSRKLLIRWQLVSEQGLTSPPTQYRSSGRQFYRLKTQPTASEY